MTLQDENGILAALVERFEKIRLPRLFDIKAKLERGERLADFDLDFLQEILADAEKQRDLLARHPEYKSLASREVALYHEITEMALSNESSAGN